MTEALLHPALAWSGWLRRRVQARSDLADWLAHAARDPVTPAVLRGWGRELCGADMFDDVSAATASDDPAARRVQLRRALRRWRERVFAALMVRDIAGLADYDEVVAATTALADAALAAAYRVCAHELAAVHGVPRDADGCAQEMLLVGMGKLGGSELNVSSDIDLVVLYASDDKAEGETDGARPLSHHEFWCKLTQRMMPLLSDADGDGYVFRTDLRLRPDGDSGPAAWSLAALARYFIEQGREWERYAWLKARAIPLQAFAGSRPQAAQHALEALRTPFVYRKYFDFDALAALRGLRMRIRLDWARRAASRDGVAEHHNVKLGQGGIREIEFVVQLGQLIRGGRMPALRQRGLLAALHAQRDAGLFSRDAALRLEAAYRFLRRTEHMLQYRDDEQTHLLPRDATGHAQLAQALGLTPDDFTRTLAEHRDFVHAQFRDAFRLAGVGETGATTAAILPESATTPVTAVAAQARTDRPPLTRPCGAPSTTSGRGEKTGTICSPLAPGGAKAGGLRGTASPPTERQSRQGLAGAGVGGEGAHTSPELQQRLAHLRASPRLRSLPAGSRARLDALVPAALRAAAQTDAPQAAATRLLDLIEAIAPRSAYLALLAEYPDTLARVARMMAASAWAAQYLTRHPLLLDGLIDWRALLAPLDINRIGDQLARDLDACVLPDGAPDVEAQMNRMRDVQRQTSFQLLAQDLEGSLSVEALADQLSALADMLLAQTLARVWPLVCGAPPNAPAEAPRFAVIAYGKLGGKELGYNSDLDLVFLYDDAARGEATGAAERYARLARRVMSWLATMTSSGRLYDADLRLRPDGNAGLLAVPVAAFARYQRDHAWVWEHQALTRARCCAGDVAIGAQFDAIRRDILLRPRDAAALAAEVRAMRARIHAGHPNPTPDFDVKHDRGGMVDVEFVTQYLVLLHAARVPALLENLGNIALLNIAGDAALIAPALARAASDAYRTLRRAQHQLRLQGSEQARVAPSLLAAERAAVTALWDAVLGAE